MDNPFTEIYSKLDKIALAVNNLHLIQIPSLKEEEGFLDINSASSFLHMPTSTIHFHKKYNGLPYLKPGKKLLFKKEDLIKWLEAFNSRSANHRVFKSKIKLRSRN